MTMPSPVPIALVDDHTLVRKGLVELIHGIGGYQVVLQASNGKEYIQALADAPPVQIAIVDLNMPVMNGFETLAWIRANTPDTRGLALTFEGNEATVIKAIRNGARGFVLKDIEPQELKAALDSIRSTGYYHSDLTHHSVMAKFERLTEREREQERIRKEVSPRELDFLQLVCSDEEHTYEEISARMDVHRRTIDGYRTSLFEKFGVKSKTGLVLYAIKWGLVRV